MSKDTTEEGRQHALPSTPIDTCHAPIIYFEEISNFGHLNGVVHLTISAFRSLSGPQGGGSTDLVAQAYLRCNIPAAIALRDTLNRVLLLIDPPADGGQNN